MGINVLMCGYLMCAYVDFSSAVLYFRNQPWSTVHTKPCKKAPGYKEIGLHLQLDGGSVHDEWCFNFALIPSKAASTSELAYPWHAGCPPLHTGTYYSQSFRAPFPAETKYSLRILINTVLQRATNNPRNVSALKPARHSLVYTFRLFKWNNTNYSPKLALGSGGGVWNCDPLF